MLQAVAQAANRSMADVVRDAVELAMPFFARSVPILEAARQAPQRDREAIKAVLHEAEEAMLGQIDFLVRKARQMHETEGPVKPEAPGARPAAAGVRGPAEGPTPAHVTTGVRSGKRGGRHPSKDGG